MDGAADVLHAAGGLLREAGTFSSDGELQEEARDLEVLAASYAARAATPADAKYMFQRSYSRMTGRQKKAELIRRKLEEEQEPPTA